VNLNLMAASALADELVRSGARDAVICPGSRSGPLALALAARLRAHTVIDERSGAFFALGAAKASGRPVAVLST
jgi:2-succinyl-5-enolpyruvyl-6-hydroxy-3-cyclohexene-1-carboxylate synthase